MLIPFRNFFRHPPQLIRPGIRWLLSSAVRRLLHKEGVTQLVCYDIGARWGVWPRFKQLPLPLHRVGFEPEPEEAKRLEQSGVFETVVPVALSAGTGCRTLYLARDPGSSSILGPDLARIQQHANPESWQVVRELPLETTTLDEAIQRFQLPPPDFLKLDVEGAEFEILSGGPHALASCAGVFFEARLVEFYRGEGLFGDLCTKLIENGFAITSFEPVGSFEGAIMLIDASACRNLRMETRRVLLLKTAAFALIVDNLEYAVACLRRVASKREILLG